GLEAIGRARWSGSDAAVPGEVLEGCAAREKEYCVALESEVERLELSRRAEQSVPPSSQTSIDLRPATEQLPPGASLSEFGAPASRVESYERLQVLLEHLD